MSDPGRSDPDRWQTFFERADIVAAFEPTEHGVAGLWTPLGNLAEPATGDEKTVLEALAKIASLFTRPDDWNTPYGPAIQLQDRRSPLHTDLMPEELVLLAEVASAIPHAGLRARTFDVLSIAVAGADRVGYATSSIDALLSLPIDASTWMTDHDAWDRALTVAGRFGAPTHTRLDKMERQLRAIIRTHAEGYVPLRAASLLAKHHLAVERSDVIGRRLLRLAGTFQSDHRRAYLRGATEWLARGGSEDEAAQVMVEEVRDLIEEAESPAGEESHAFRAAQLYEEALQRVRRIPKAQRQRLGVTDLPSTIARRIRELGALSIGSMSVVEHDPIDLSDAARDSRNRVKDLPIADALSAFVGLGGWVAIDKEIETAKEQMNEFPLHLLFSRLHLSSDGRVTHRSGGQGGTPIYGIDPAVWDTIMRTFDLRLKLMAQGVLYPAWTQLTNEHRMSVSDFVLIVSNTPIVPPDHVFQFARALYAGFNGDFSSAMQLLAPQIEAVVRFHLANAGVATSTIDKNSRVETEIGLSGLMERSEAEQIFGRDLAFEIRMLFCGPLGPNIRNNSAHGLIPDHAAMSTTAVYSWWFAMKLVFIAFWNSIHDTEAAEAREPSRPGERGGPEKSSHDEGADS